MKYILIPTILLFNILCNAQTIINLDPLSVTSSRYSQKISETGRSITIIEGKKIQDYPIQSIDELLKYASSVEIQQRGPAGSQADIVIRGGTFQQVLVLLDGVKLNDPITGHFSSYMPIVTSQIDRIEILRGPAAAVYGSEAVGGVINIISKTFSTYQKEATNHGSGALTAGEYGFFSANAGFNHTSKHTNYSLAAQSNNASGQLLRGNNRGYFSNNLFSANAAFELKKNWKLMLHSSYDSRDFAAQNFYTSFISDTAEEKVNTFWNHLKLKQTTANSSNEIDLAIKRTNDNYLYNPLALANENQSKSLSFQFVHSKIETDHFSYNYGCLAEQKNIRSNDRGNHDNNHIAAFGSLIFKVKKLTLNPGGRMVIDENYGSKFLPQTNLSYTIGRFALKANAGKAIRSADFTERYNNYNKSIVKSGSIGNPDLATENSWSYEAGTDLLLKNIKLSVSWFYRDQDEVIDWVTTGYSNMPRKENLIPSGTYALATNIKKVRTSGFELGLDYVRTFNAENQLNTNFSATFIKSNSSDSIPSFYIISHAKLLLQQTLIYSFKKIKLSITSIYKERNPQKTTAINASLSANYWLMNAKISYGYKMTTTFISVNNIGNVKYSDLLGSTMPGSWATAGVAFSF
jgi:iron complex outermembrane receptor protein